MQRTVPVNGTSTVDFATTNGTAVNSGPYDGLSTPEFKQRITADLEKAELGRGAVNYKLRDWLFSRQRYWGEPFPITWKNGQHSSINAAELPLAISAAGALLWPLERQFC